MEEFQAFVDEEPLYDVVPQDELNGQARLHFLYYNLPDEARFVSGLMDDLLAFPTQYISRSAIGTIGGSEFKAFVESAHALCDAMRLSDEGRWEEAGALRQKHSRLMLVRGVYRSTDFRNCTLTLDDGTSVKLGMQPFLEPKNGASLWGVLVADPILTPHGPCLRLIYWEPVTANDLWIPDYGAETLVESFITSRFVREVARWLTYPLGEEGLRGLLTEIHAPPTAEAVKQVRDEAFRDGVTRRLAEAGAAVPTLPEPRLIKNHRAAEEYASEVMRAIGFADAIVTPAGADGGVDVRSLRAVAQVKMEGVASTRPQVQQLVGIARVERKIPIFFSLAGFTDQARIWADMAGVACFEFEFDGSVKPVGTLAEGLLRGQHQEDNGAV
jgi:hypothetical protein